MCEESARGEGGEGAAEGGVGAREVDDFEEEGVGGLWPGGMEGGHVGRRAHGVRRLREEKRGERNVEEVESGQEMAFGIVGIRVSSASESSLFLLHRLDARGCGKQPFR